MKRTTVLNHRLGILAALSIAFACLPSWAAVAAVEVDARRLASADFDGRMTGSDGAQAAAKYIVEKLTEYGAQPLPGSESLLRPFEFAAGVNDAGSRLQLKSSAEPNSWTGVEHIRALSFSENASVTGEVVFAGYGLKIPESPEFSYDSYFGLDVKDKIVIVLRYAPEDVDDERRGELTRYSGLRYKALQARKNGAKAILVVTGPRSPRAGKTIDSRFDAALAGSGIVAASIDGEIGERLFQGIGGGLEAAQKSLDGANPHVGGFALPGIRLTVDVRVERERRQGQNVLAYLPPKPEGDHGLVMLGAHFDHLGRGGHGDSRAGEEEEGQIHPGADDNASGVAAVLDVGRQLAKREQRPGTLLAFWSGEELGLLGSAHFVKQSPLPLDHVDGYLNFDMVGRMRENRLNLQGVGSSEAWARLIEQTNVMAGFDLQLQEDPYLPTDAAQLYQAGVPVVSFFTGTHDDYHRPTDSADKLNYEGMQRIADFATRFSIKLGALETAPAYVEVERSKKVTGDRDSARAYTGTIPDYATEVRGLRLSGVVAGGPAASAGIEAGDVIVEFAGREITNISDYSDALDAVKVGNEVAVVCMRGEKRLEFTITPTHRP